MSIFTYTNEEFQEIASEILKLSAQKGASDAVVEITESEGFSVLVRAGEVDTIEQNKDKGIGLTIFLGDKKATRRGNASTSDFSLKSLKDTVDAAYNIACFTAEDDCAGLPDEFLLQKNHENLDLFFPWDLSIEEAVEIAKKGESAAYLVDSRVSNSDGSNIYIQQSHFFMANSRGFEGGYPSTRHSISVNPIVGKGENMQRDGWYSLNRNPKKLSKIELIGVYAAKRALSKLNSRKLKTCKCPVLFEAPVAAGILGSFVQATSGGALYRKTTFLLDSIGTKIFPDDIQISEDPKLLGGLGSCSFDDEGVITTKRDVVSDGTLNGYFLSSYSARKLGMQTTGNAGGSHNLRLFSKKTKNHDDFVSMLNKLNTGLLVTDLMGQGVNYVTGDYSRGASGFWVENGEIIHPVEEITIAGNLKTMFKNIIAVGSDEFIMGKKRTGSILIGQMTIAGN